MIEKTLKLAGQLFGWLFEKCWAEPCDIKGPLWTAAMLTSLVTGFALLQVIPRSHFAVAGIFVASWLVMRWEGKRPKKLGRQLPYRRRRR